MLLYILLIASVSLMTACEPIVFFGAAVSTGVTITQDEGPQYAVSDSMINVRIRTMWMKTDPKILESLGYMVHHGRVVIFGSHPNAHFIEKSIQLLKTIPSIKETINATQVQSTTRNNYATDSWINTKIKSSLLLNPNVALRNLCIETFDRWVYVLGVIASEHEQNEIRNEIQKIKGVRNISFYVRLKPSAHKNALSN